MKCDKCGGEMVQMIYTSFCKAECDKAREYERADKAKRMLEIEVASDDPDRFVHELEARIRAFPPTPGSWGKITDLI